MSASWTDGSGFFPPLNTPDAILLADMKGLAEDPVIQKWWKETDPCQIPLPAAAKAGEIWTPVGEVYRLK
jgi:L-rhamnose mutarotase